MRRKQQEEGEKSKEIDRQLPDRKNKGRNPLVNVRLRRESVWFASDIDIIRVLVHSHVVNRHDGREGQMFEIDKSEIGRDSQVENHVLGVENNQESGWPVRNEG